VDCGLRTAVCVNHSSMHPVTTLSRNRVDHEAHAASESDPITSIDDPRYVKAMSHPLRVRILALLDERTASPVELAGWLGATLGTVAYHVRTLERMGLIDLAGETRVRGAVEHHYRAKPRPRVSDEAWAAAPPIAKQAAVSASLQTIDAYARAASADGGFDHGNAHLTRTALHLDARGYGEVSRACKRLLGQLERIEEAAQERMQRNPHSGESREVSLAMMLFETSRLSGESGGAPTAATRRRRELAVVPD
jgi:DNA-binding transcriptional ArsR family regulator